MCTVISANAVNLSSTVLDSRYVFSLFTVEKLLSTQAMVTGSTVQVKFKRLFFGGGAPVILPCLCHCMYVCMHVCMYVCVCVRVYQWRRQGRGTDGPGPLRNVFEFNLIVFPVTTVRLQLFGALLL